MALNTEQKAAALKWLNDELFGKVAKTADLTSDDLEAAIEAVDDWKTTGNAGYISAIPQPYQSKSNAPEKALLLSAIEYGRLNAS